MKVTAKLKRTNELLSKYGYDFNLDEAEEEEYTSIYHENASSRDGRGAQLILTEQGELGLAYDDDDYEYFEVFIKNPGRASVANMMWHFMSKLEWERNAEREIYSVIEQFVGLPVENALLFLADSKNTNYPRVSDGSNYIKPRWMGSGESSFTDDEINFVVDYKEPMTLCEHWRKEFPENRYILKGIISVYYVLDSRSILILDIHDTRNPEDANKEMKFPMLAKTDFEKSVLEKDGNSPYAFGSSGLFGEEYYYYYNPFKDACYRLNLKNKETTFISFEKLEYLPTIFGKISNYYVKQFSDFDYSVWFRVYNSTYDALLFENKDFFVLLDSIQELNPNKTLEIPMLNIELSQEPAFLKGDSLVGGGRLYAMWREVNGEK
ncbi:MAG: hypothetical protein LBM27_05675 [Lactobacillaceae bacterium]|jgi:hypothetical protein|nr:hypothetical protein [Lactobacillaceae bacterium]